MPNPRKSALGVFLHDLDVAVYRTQLDCRFSSTASQHVDFRGFCRSRSRNRRIIKVVGDSSVSRFGNKMESSLAGKKRPAVSLRDICLNRKRSTFPPFVGNGEIASL